ncbi:hypothetical protein N177_4089 [Lutibaculum baratangense AMV1]|uniref:Uncharacterized protein n=1 Tax=Lutibaculum baratangense AMV1 TaxID=631454 RepID=V4RAU9_9HYPH|nr:hypothetical protein N177_4089 [Lutibaculum baratangense AMV1]
MAAALGTGSISRLRTLRARATLFLIRNKFSNRKRVRAGWRHGHGPSSPPAGTRRPSAQ